MSATSIWVLATVLLAVLMSSIVMLSLARFARRRYTVLSLLWMSVLFAVLLYKAAPQMLNNLPGPWYTVTATALGPVEPEHYTVVLQTRYGRRHYRWEKQIHERLHEGDVVEGYVRNHRWGNVYLERPEGEVTPVELPVSSVYWKERGKNRLDVPGFGELVLNSHDGRTVLEPGTEVSVRVHLWREPKVVHVDDPIYVFHHHDTTMMNNITNIILMVGGLFMIYWFVLVITGQQQRQPGLAIVTGLITSLATGLSLMLHGLMPIPAVLWAVLSGTLTLSLVRWWRRRDTNRHAAE
ncbi:MAG: hypothetical protein HUJ29_10005 [Gammaproteobacteria bacterium]|nr:hypothetical protein [Gammaproteobacteria bacterium]